MGRPKIYHVVLHEEDVPTFTYFSATFCTVDIHAQFVFAICSWVNPFPFALSKSSNI